MLFRRLLILLLLILLSPENSIKDLVHLIRGLLRLLLLGLSGSGWLLLLLLLLSTQRP